MKQIKLLKIVKNIQVKDHMKLVIKILNKKH